MSLPIITYMDAADTATTVLDVSGGAKVVDILAGTAHFSGVLLT